MRNSKEALDVHGVGPTVERALNKYFTLYPVGTTPAAPSAAAAATPPKAGALQMVEQRSRVGRM